MAKDKPRALPGTGTVLLGQRDPGVPSTLEETRPSVGCAPPGAGIAVDSGEQRSPQGHCLGLRVRDVWKGDPGPTLQTGAHTPAVKSPRKEEATSMLAY